MPRRSFERVTALPRTAVFPGLGKPGKARHFIARDGKPNERCALDSLYVHDVKPEARRADIHEAFLSLECAMTCWQSVRKTFDAEDGLKTREAR